MFWQFGIGAAFGTPYGAHAAGSPTPLQFITLQDISIDFTFANKPLMGQFQYPVAVARGEGKVDIKAKVAKMGAKFLNDFMFAGTVGAGQKLIVPNESHVAAASITISPPNAGTFDADQGVVDANGNEMILTGSAPAIGSYEVNNSTGVYTFNAGQTGPLFISYSYSIATGTATPLPNEPMGQQPLVNLWVANSNWSNNFAIRFPACIFHKLTLPQKNTDWSIPDLEASAFADSVNNIAYLYTDN